MGQPDYQKLLQAELERIDQSGSGKRQEKIITKFTAETPPRAVIEQKKYYIFNSNDYLSLRLNPVLKKAEHEASQQYGTGPGAVRFISGSLQVHRDLEKAIAQFHGREDAVVFSSAFAANLGVIFPLIKAQVKTSLVQDKVLVVSDQLNHRSIIDAIRLANLPKENRAIFKHLDFVNLEEIIKKAMGNFERIVIVSDGVFSMIGELQDLAKLQILSKRYDEQFKHGIMTIIDDAHGVGAVGQKGRGVEEVFHAQADVLIGTFGKAFGCDGGYVVANQTIIDYLRESAATYIYSNSIPPASAGAALAAVKLLDTPEGKQILIQLKINIEYFKTKAKKAKLPFAADSQHPVQPILIGDTLKTKKAVQQLFKQGYLTTAIGYPVVPAGRDEIRIQINANHTNQSINRLIDGLSQTLNGL